MTLVLLILATVVVAASCSSGFATGRGTNDSAAEAEHPPSEPVSFEADVLPILSESCRPCHFEGGKMHEELPFDRPETIRKLGDRLFTRIRGEEE
ncbi:MAG: hypothetical protein ACREQY_08345, partial [Candidatus Binatia bacterium]